MIANGGFVPKVWTYTAPAFSRGELLSDSNRERLWAVSSKYGINHGIIHPWFYDILINIVFIGL